MSYLVLGKNTLSPYAPTAGKIIAFFKSDGYLYIKDETGVETKMQLISSNSNGMGKVIAMNMIFGG